MVWPDTPPDRHEGLVAAMAIHGSLFTQYQENPSADPFVLQNKHRVVICR